MFGSQILEVAIGVVFVYLLVSMICSAVREGIEGKLRARAAYLERGIMDLLHDHGESGLISHFYNHPLIFSLFNGQYPPTRSKLAPAGELPSYIPTKNFALALMDLAARGVTTNEFNSAATAPPITVEAIRTNILNISSPQVQRVLLAAVDTAQNDINKVQASLEAWYDSAMDRVSGAYKRSTQWILFVVGLIVAVGLNVNTVAISEYLYKNDAARAAVVSKAEAAAADKDFLSKQSNAANADLRALDLPIGWERMTLANPRVDGWWTTLIGPLVGWLMTALAATLGAPFWFDILNKFMVIRSTVKPHEKSPEESSEDRQKPPAPAAAPPTAQAPPAPPVPPAPPPAQAEPKPDEEVDGCDVEPAEESATSDEELPAAEGGVA